MFFCAWKTEETFFCYSPQGDPKVLLFCKFMDYKFFTKIHVPVKKSKYWVNPFFGAGGGVIITLVLLLLLMVY